MVGAQTLGHTVRMGDLQKGLFASSHLSTQNDWFTFQAKGVRESTPITGEMISLSQCPQNLYLLPSRELALTLSRASRAQGIALNSARPETLSLAKGAQLQNSKASSCWVGVLDKKLRCSSRVTRDTQKQRSRFGDGGSRIRGSTQSLQVDDLGYKPQELSEC